jgi:hypothetical protein
MMKAIPAAPLLFWRFLIALVNMSFAGPGATLPRLSIRDWVVPLPSSPRIDTRARIAGKIASTP